MEVYNLSSIACSLLASAGYLGQRKQNTINLSGFVRCASRSTMRFGCRRIVWLSWSNFRWVNFFDLVPAIWKNKFEIEYIGVWADSIKVDRLSILFSRSPSQPFFKFAQSGRLCFKRFLQFFSLCKLNQFWTLWLKHLEDLSHLMFSHLT